MKNRGRKYLHRLHFVYPAANLSNQFEDFVDVCAWLISEITGDNNTFKRDQYDDPNTGIEIVTLTITILTNKNFSRE